MIAGTMGHACGFLLGKFIVEPGTMAEPATTRMSSKGQVVIPGKIRKRLGLEAGTRFVVVAEKDTIILKAISPPSVDDFDALIGEARKQARKAGLKPSDIKAIIDKVRCRS